MLNLKGILITILFTTQMFAGESVSTSNLVTSALAYTISTLHLDFLKMLFSYLTSCGNTINILKYIFLTDTYKRT